MTATIHKLPTPVLRATCSACGTEATCDCNAPYVPARERAAAAIAANPEKSDRAIGAEIGVSHVTVGKARKATGNQLPVEKRVGRDGKLRRKPASPDPEPIADFASGDDVVMNLLAAIDIAQIQWDELNPKGKLTASSLLEGLAEARSYIDQIFNELVRLQS